MVTVAENVRAKVEKAAKWRDENPSCIEYEQDAPKIYIEKELLESKAWKSLSRCSTHVYLEFLGKRVMSLIKRNRKKVWVISNNGEIVYTYADAEEDGFSRVKFRNAIDELQQKGFIDITHQGKGGRKPVEGTGDVSQYAIDNRWKKYGTDDFRPRKLRIKDNRTDRGWSVYHRNKK